MQKVPPIQFTKGELEMIDRGIDQFFREWYNGYRSAGRVCVAGRIREKVRHALQLRSAEGATPPNTPAGQAHLAAQENK